MQKIEFEVKVKKELIKAIIDELPFLSRFDVKKILSDNKTKLDKVVDYLLEHGEITEEELIEQFNS